MAGACIDRTREIPDGKHSLERSFGNSDPQPLFNAGHQFHPLQRVEAEVQLKVRVRTRGRSRRELPNQADNAGKVRRQFLVERKCIRCSMQAGMNRVSSQLPRCRPWQRLHRDIESEDPFVCR